MSASFNNASNPKIGGNTPVTTPTVTGVLPRQFICPKTLAFVRVTGVLPTCYPPKVTTPPLYKSGGVTGPCCRRVILKRGIDLRRAQKPWNPYSPHTMASGIPLPRMSRNPTSRSTDNLKVATGRTRRHRKDG